MKIFRHLTLCVALSAALAATSAPNLPKRTINGKEYYYYDVPSKETIYSIGRKFGFTRDEIIRYNPQVQDGLRAGDTLFFPVEEAAEAPAAVEEPVAETPVTETPVEEVVAEVEEEAVAETVEPAPAIVEEPVPVIEEPAPSIVEEPIAEQVQPLIAPVDVTHADTVGLDGVRLGSNWRLSPFAPASAPASASEPLNVAVMLPFMLDAEGVTRSAQNQTDFYRGMLLAVEELAPRSNFHVNVYAYDSKGSADVAAQTLRRPEFAEMDYIIAPGDSESLERIAKTADKGSTTVLNLFAVKYDGEQKHESVVQANIPREAMYQHAIDVFCEQFADSKVIIANPTDLHTDKAEFVADLIKTLVKAGIPYEKIDFEGRLDPETLAELPVRDYVFVPTGASREVLMRILPSLVSYQEAVPQASVRLFGYPDWVTLRGEIKENLHKLNTAIYSRFSTELDNQYVRRVQENYRHWYGHEMPQAVPNTVLLGYDTMAWLIYASEHGLTEPYEGLQNAFMLREIPGAGNVNNALYFITFRRGGTVDAQVL